MLSPSKGAAVLGVSRFDAPYALWHRTKGLIAPEPDKDIFRAGHAYEHTLAYLWRAANPGWQLSPGEVRFQRDDLGVPALATIDRRASRGRARRVVEFKIARSLEEWGDDFTDEAPADYLVQVTLQQLITGYTKYPAHLMVMGPYFKSHTYEIPFNQELADVILERCVSFWKSLDSDVPPPLDDTKATYECVRELHPDIDGREVQLDPELAAEYLTVDGQYKALEKRLRGLKSRVLAAMEKGQRAVVVDQKIADRRPNGKGSVSLYANTKLDPTTIEGIAA